jgi:hypothetical protein
MHDFSLFGLTLGKFPLPLKAARPAPRIRSYFAHEAFFVKFDLLQHSGDAPVIAGHELGVTNPTHNFLA